MTTHWTFFQTTQQSLYLVHPSDTANITIIIIILIIIIINNNDQFISLAANHYEGQQVHIYIYIQNQCWHAGQNNQSTGTQASQVTIRFSTGKKLAHRNNR